MIGWLKRKIAWAVAGRELAELERWRVECGVAERWLAEFSDVRYALDYVKDAAQYGGRDISKLRDSMRRRRDATPVAASLAPLEKITTQIVERGLRELGFPECEFHWTPVAARGEWLDKLMIRAINSPPETMSQFEQDWRDAYAAMPLVPPSTPPATDLDAVEQYMDSVRVFEHALFADPPAPTHYEGLFPAALKS